MDSIYSFDKTSLNMPILKFAKPLRPRRVNVDVEASASRTKMRAGLAVLLVFAVVGGCAAHGEPAKAKLVTLAELEAETADLDRISYLGTDPQFHYFKTEGGVYYKLPEDQWSPANRDEMIYPINTADIPGPNEPGFELYVAVRKGQVVLAPLP
jgi:hypothetical protein